MQRIQEHPILSIESESEIVFNFDGHQIVGRKGHSIAAALHQNGYPVHSHSLQSRKRSLECGIGKCGACEMLVDGEVKRICVTSIDNVKTVATIAENYLPPPTIKANATVTNVYRTQVVIVGAGPAGLAVREKLNEAKVDCLVVDSNDEIGGQFLMQTHKFFFFEKELKYGGLRGFEIAKTLAGDNLSGILLSSTVWDILEGNRLGVKNTRTGEKFYVDAEYLVVAAGAVPFMPTFENDDLPGVYTAAVVQKMMNTDLTLLGKNILTVGAGNIGYLTSYQLMQAGANVKAIIEAQPREGGFPVQANRLRRLGVPILTSHILLKAIPNATNDGVTGALIARCENFKPVPGTECIINGIDAINICTGLVQDDALLIKGKEMFGRRCLGAGDALRIGEGTSAVLRGQQVALEILEDLRKGNYDDYLKISKEYIDSQQHPIRVIEQAEVPTAARMEKPFVQIDCLYGFACNPCQFACKYGAITKTSSSEVPRINFDKCIGCMQCVTACPGLAIFGYNTKNSQVFLPLEFTVNENESVWLVDNNGIKICDGHIEKITKNATKTHLARVKCNVSSSADLLKIRGFIEKSKYPEPLTFTPAAQELNDAFVCHCEDVNLHDILQIIGSRKVVTVEEIKHTTHLGMGPCRGKRCFLRLRQVLRGRGVELVGESAPRAPLSSQVLMGELYPTNGRENTIVKQSKVIEVPSLVAGGGIGGSAIFRYLAEAKLQPTLVNTGFGASWRNIAAGRPAFSIPELSEIACHNLEIFKDLDNKYNIDFAEIYYITFAHDHAMQAALEASMGWQKARMLAPSEFVGEISPHFNKNNSKYMSALKSSNCWQASPGKTINAIRNIGINLGGTVHEVNEVVDVHKDGDTYTVLVKSGDSYIEYRTKVFVNAMGANGEKFAKKVGVETPLFPVKHQAFITRRLPMLGVNGKHLDMLIDRRKYKGFGAVYGQQLKSTGQIIGCASPLIEPNETQRDLRTNSLDFVNIASEIFIDWIPMLASIGFQAVWAGYYVEPRMVIDPKHGLFLGLKGHGFMNGQYIAKMYVDSLLGKEVPSYFSRMSLTGDGLTEAMFK